jgi:hypothetical protein
MEKRRYPRLRTEQMIGDISDGRHVVRGRIVDFSTGGCRIVGLPKSFEAGNHTYTAIISNRDKHYKLLVSPRWSRSSDALAELEMGFKILDSTWEWVFFSELEDEGSLPSA